MSEVALNSCHEWNVDGRVMEGRSTIDGETLSYKRPRTEVMDENMEEDEEEIGACGCCKPGCMPCGDPDDEDMSDQESASESEEEVDDEDMSDQESASESEEEVDERELYADSQLPSVDEEWPSSLFRRHGSAMQSVKKFLRWRGLDTKGRNLTDLIERLKAAVREGAPLLDELAEEPEQQARRERAERADGKRSKKEANQRKAQEEYKRRVDAFNAYANDKVKAPEHATKGISPWKRPGVPANSPHEWVKVMVAQVPGSTVPAYGTTLSTLRHGEVELLPTGRNVLLVEAGCGAQKTRTLLAWVKEVLDTNLSMPILFIVSRKTHADDTAHQLKEWELFEQLGFRVYLDAKDTEPGECTLCV